MKAFVVFALLGAGLASLSGMRRDPYADDRAAVAGLDSAYQAAVKQNDMRMMDKILATGFVLVTGDGSMFTKADLLQQAHDKSSTYEHQESTDQVVRLYGNTAVVSAKLWIKGTSGTSAFDFHVWYSDTYVKTPAGWRYAFGQAGCHLP
jgi:ketosteroid isomerase-like protein